jgi:hypothetical protein
VLLCLLPFGCAVFSAPAYDPNFDRGATELQEKLNAHFDELQRTVGTPAGAWEPHAPFYESVRADLTNLLYFAGTQRGNDATVRSLELIATNVDEVETAHRKGLSSREIPTGMFDDVDSYDIYTQPSPTLAQMQEYCAILVFTDYTILDNVTFGNNLAGYVVSLLAFGALRLKG